MRKPLLAALAALCSLSPALRADTPKEAALRSALESRIGQGLKIDAVEKTPYAGLYELRVGTQVYYSDESGRYLVVGKVIDTADMRDLTAARVADLSRVPFSSLPLDKAIKTVRGKGTRVVAVFEDPNCGYCKRLRQTLAGMDDVTVYTFMLNIISEDSPAKSAAIWCAPDRVKAWDDWMLRGTLPAKPGACKTPNDEVLALGGRLGIHATPTLVFKDGSRIASALDAASLEAKLSAVR